MKLQIRRADVWLCVGCAFAVLMTAGVFAAQGGARSAHAMAARVSGSVEYQTAAKQPWHAVKIGMALSEGLRCRTGAGSSLDLALTTGAIVRLNADTEIRLDKLAFEDRRLPAAGKASTTRTHLTIERGQIISQVGKRSPSSAFEVKTPVGRVEVHGAEFMIWGVTNRIFVRSFQDTVVLRIGGQEYTIHAGEEMSAEFNSETGAISNVQSPGPAQTGNAQAVQHAAFKAETALLATAVIDKGVVDFGQLLETLKTSDQPLPGVIVVGNPATTTEISPSKP